MAKRYNISLPTTWDDLTLKEFIQIKKLYDKYENNVPIITLLSHLTKKDEKYFKDAPALVITKLVEKINFLREPLPSDASNSIEIDNKIYYINSEEDLKFGEFVDSQTVLESDPDNFPALLTILCRLPEEIYNDDFIAKTLTKRIKMFENQPMSKCQPLLIFFLLRLQDSVEVTKQFSKAKQDQINCILEALENSEKSGHGKERFTIWRKIKLARLKRSLKRTAQQYFNF